MMPFVAGAILTLLTMPPTAGQQPAQRADRWARVIAALFAWTILLWPAPASGQT